MKVKKPFWEAWELLPAAIIFVVSAVVSALWWRVANVYGEAAGKALPMVWLALLGMVIYVVRFGRYTPKQQTQYLRILAHLTATNLLWLVFWDFWNWKHLSSEWYRDTTLFTGLCAINLIVASLACTPLITLTRVNAFTALKKPLGNYGFAFVLLHLFLFILDYGRVGESIRFDLVVQEAILKRYALVGFLAFLLLIPLAATSNVWAQKRLGKRWKKLHQAVYLINILVVVHFVWVWLSKRALGMPLLYGFIVAILLSLRLPKVKAWMKGLPFWKR